MDYYTDRLNISNDDFEKIKNKKIGEGNDAVVYNAGKGLLYKIYKKNYLFEYIDKPDKIYTKFDKEKEVSEKLLYLDKDEVKIYYKDAVKMITKRGKNIKLSSLPKASLYIDNKFKGFVLEKINGIQIHKIFSILSKKTKMKILKEIINAVKELTNNYIYPIDLDNSPHVYRHSNILLNYILEPKLIDLDGNSTLYRESYDKSCYLGTLYSLNTLFLELLEEDEMPKDLHYFDIQNIKNNLIEKGIYEELACKLSQYEADYDDLEEFARLYLRIK